ncbi:hypothetical protein BHE74_00037157 [Ensete ventricosum]|nr:hypothetical protein BHE74_00037157 [Ensete ventricosum]
MSPISTSQSTDSSKAFFSSPFLRFEKVTCRLALFSIRFISVFPLTIRIDDSPLSLSRQMVSPWKKGYLLRGNERRLRIRRSSTPFHYPNRENARSGAAEGGPKKTASIASILVSFSARCRVRVYGSNPAFHLEAAPPWVSGTLFPRWDGTGKPRAPEGGFSSPPYASVRQADQMMPRSRPERIIAIAARHVASPSSCFD